MCKKIICRENIGYDFMSYKIGLLEAGVEYKKYDEILICNDSVYGPLFDLKKALLLMSKKNCDFWGIFQSKQQKAHLQSFFITFKKKIIESEALEHFFSQISILESKEDIIVKYEIGLTQFLRIRGFKFKSLFDTPSLTKKLQISISYLKRKPFFKNDKYNFIIATTRKCIRVSRNLIEVFIMFLTNNVNPSHHYWKEIIETKIPFIKIELLRKNPCLLENSDEIISYINKRTDYPVYLIQNHLSRTTSKY
jgi:rhamnosyltransferase